MGRRQRRSSWQRHVDRYPADRGTHVISRHEVGNVGPTLRSLILKYWQCGPELQRPACRSGCSSVQTVATEPSVVEVGGVVAVVAEVAAASRSAALIEILFDIFRVPCKLRVGDVQMFEWTARVVTRWRTPSAPMRGCITAIASIAYRYFQNSVVLRIDRSEPDHRRTTTMTNSPLTALAERLAANRRDRIGSWVARFFSQPAILKISQTTEWDNDVPPFPILGGAVARAERTGSSK